jgi:hypothetical protein
MYTKLDLILMEKNLSNFKNFHPIKVETEGLEKRKKRKLYHFNFTTFQNNKTFIM